MCKDFGITGEEIAMRLLFKVIVFLSVTAIFLSLGCSTKETEQVRRARLVGTWQLLVRHDCENSPVQSDTLILNSDGSFQQHTVLKNGHRFDSVGQHWSYVEKDSVALDMRRAWNRPGKPNSVEGTDLYEVLLVQFGSPSVILINPHEDCLYQKIG